MEYIPRGSCNTSLWYMVYYLGEKRWAWSRNDSRSKLVPNVHRWRRAQQQPDATPRLTPNLMAIWGSWEKRADDLDARLREVERKVNSHGKEAR